MVLGFGSCTGAGAHTAHRRFIRIIAVAALAALLGGCAGYPTQADFKDPHKSLALMYVRYDDNSPIALWAHLRHPGTDDDVAMVWVQGTGAKTNECSLYVAAIPAGVYEFSQLSGDRLAYRFPQTSDGNFSLHVGSRQDVYMLGEFDMHAIAKTEGMEENAFSFKRASGCPGNKAAYKTLLNADIKEWLKGTRWPAVLMAKSR